MAQGTIKKLVSDRGFGFILPDGEAPTGKDLFFHRADVKGGSYDALREGQQVSYVVDVDGVRCAFLSSPLQDWTDYELELLGDIDVLAISGEKPKVVQKIVEEVDPRMVVITPIDGKVEGGIVAACGGEGVEPTKEFKLKGSLPPEGRQVVVLKV